MYARAGLDANGIVAKVFEAFGSGIEAAALQPAQMIAGSDRKKTLRTADVLQTGSSRNGGAI
jgi:hypothetical protein